MKAIHELEKEIKSAALLPLFYHADKDKCVEVAKALYAAGVRIIEFTARGERALENFNALVIERNKQMPDLLLAVGTIRTAEQAIQFLNGGADFLISPVFDESIHTVAKDRNALWIPGCMTPSEIHVADGAGCRLIKLFPGNVLGPSYVESILPLFPHLDFFITGGVDTSEQNLAAWFSAGVSGVGLGSKLISKKLLDANNFIGLQKETETLLQTINRLKTS